MVVRMTRVFPIVAISLALVAGCGGSDNEVAQDEVDALQAEIDALQTENDGLRDQLSTASITNALESEDTAAGADSAAPLESADDGSGPSTTTTSSTSTSTSTTTSTSITTTTVPDMPWTVEELNEILAPPMVDYAATFGPSATREDQDAAWIPVKDALSALLNADGRSVTDVLLAPEAISSWQTASEALTSLYESGRSFAVDKGLRDYGYHFNLPTVWEAIERIPRSFRSGTYRVGNGSDEVPPGTYVAESDTPFDGCYWETLDSSGDIIDNNFVGSGFRVVANVPSGALSVEFDRCGTFWKQ